MGIDVGEIEAAKSGVCVSAGEEVGVVSSIGDGAAVLGVVLTSAAVATRPHMVTVGSCRDLCFFF